jgi:hypothetical protein
MTRFSDEFDVVCQWRLRQNSERDTPERRTKINSFFRLVRFSLWVFIASLRQSCSFTTTENALRSPVLLDRKYRISVASQDFSCAASRSSSSSIDELSKKRDARAGQDGYSLLRQPLQRDTWDSSKDPKFRQAKLGLVVLEAEANNIWRNNCLVVQWRWIRCFRRTYAVEGSVFDAFVVTS